MMAAQKRKKKMLAEFFVFLNVYLPKTQQIRFTTFLDSFIPYGRLWGNQKAGALEN